MGAKLKGIHFTFNKALLIIWIAIFLIIGINSPSFFSTSYIINVMLRNIIEIGLVALPMTLIIITGGIDLSVGNLMVLSAMLGGIAFTRGGVILALIVTILTGVLGGFINGVVIAKAKISPMVATLATMYLYLGLARGISAGDSIYSYSFAEFMGTTSIAGLPVQLWLYIVLAIIFTILLGSTVFGRKLYGIGLNENATQYAGINIDRVLIMLYVICGTMCALAAFIWLGRFTSVKYDAGTAFNLKAITIVVLGGTSITGGVGDMKGTILGTLIIATLNSGLTVMNIPIDVQTIVQGTVLIVALIASSIVQKRAKQSTILKVAVPKAETN